MPTVDTGPLIVLSWRDCSYATSTHREEIRHSLTLKRHVRSVAGIGHCRERNRKKRPSFRMRER
ncbi:hypothetical protein KCP71_26095 (plasmid) [Salmonella enterica subsp. enterica]|nr:hypothetical protein KCP71_26095 [Salmonella enterica subsp. enterica]